MFLIGLLLGAAGATVLAYRYHGTLEYWVDFWRRAK